MARLFSKDYHDSSTSWYFNHAVIALSQGDLWYWFSLDEAGNYQMRFFPSEEKREYFSEYIDVTYDPINERILRHRCPECREEEPCRHYLSLLRYAYHFISTDIFTEDAVQTCDGEALRGSTQLLEIVYNARIQLEGIYDPNTDKIRFYHSSYQDIDIIALLKPGKLDSLSQYPLSSILSEYELQLFHFLQDNRAAYSIKGKFWSLYKKHFPIALALMEQMKERIQIKETGELLEFSNIPYPLALRIEPRGKTEYCMYPVLVEELSTWFAGYPTWLLFKNHVHKIYLPFQDDVVNSIFSKSLYLSEKDLIYYRSIVHSELLRKNIYLDFDSGIDLPLIIDSYPKTRLHLKGMGEHILAEGFLVYEGVYEIPLSLLRFRKPLIFSAYTRGDEIGNAWFHIPHSIFAKVDKLLEDLPKPEMNRLEQNAQLVFSIQAFEALQKAIFQLSEEHWEIEIDEELRSSFITKIPLQVEMQTFRGEDIDWFSYQVNYRYRDLSFSHQELKRYFKSQEEFLHTMDGRIFFISNPEVFHEVDALIEHSSRLEDSDVYRARILALPYYLRLREENPAFRMAGDEYIESMFKDLLQRRMGRNPELPIYLQTVLRGYQKNGVSWIRMLQNYHLNGILADEMGLGKTIQALTVILSAHESTVCMVICPKTLLYNWAAEIEKFHTNIPFAIVEGNKESRLEILQNPNTRLFIMSYSMVLSDYAILKDIRFEWIVLDEAQNIKNVSAQRTAAIKKLNSAHRLALSGTPVENNLTELWSIMDFLMPGYLGTLKKFKDMYLASTDGGKAKLSLHRAVAPFIMRRVKKEVLLELPDKQEQVSWCKLNPIQEKMYLQILDMVHKKLLPDGSSPVNFVHILAALTKLRQLCNHPHLANGDILPEVEASTKLEQLIELVQDSIEGGHKVLVFSQFVQMLSIMRKTFDRLGIRYSYLDGKTQDRSKPVYEFETNEDIRLFLISLKAGGTGLNLTAADTVILYDPWWNPMVENQAIDRTHRIGQTRKVQVFRLISKGTVEEKIMALQQSKLDMFNDVIEGGTSILKTMNVEDLKGLFSYDR